MKQWVEILRTWYMYTKKNGKDNYMKMVAGKKIVDSSKLKLWSFLWGQGECEWPSHTCIYNHIYICTHGRIERGTFSCVQTFLNCSISCQHISSCRKSSPHFTIAPTNSVKKPLKKWTEQYTKGI